MAKKYEVTFMDSTYLPQVPGSTSSFSVPLPEEFDSREKAEEYVREVERRSPKTKCGIREIEGKV